MGKVKDIYEDVLARGADWRTQKRKGSLKKQMERHLGSRPTYKIAEEARENVSLTRKKYRGRNRAITNAEENISRAGQEGLYAAQNTVEGSSGLLSSAQMVVESMNQGYRNLAGQEDLIKGQDLNRLTSANEAMIVEKDKAFDYNVNQPYQTRLEELRLRRKRKQQVVDKLIDFGAGTAMAIASGGGSLGGLGGGATMNASRI